MRIVETLEPFFSLVRHVIMFFAYIAGFAVCAMISVTTIDVVLRIFRSGIPGAYDLVRVAGSIAISCALPYVTAVKGHIAIEFFYHSFSRRGRQFLDALFRTIALALFALLACRFIIYGASLRKSGEVMPTLGIPVFWIPWLFSICFMLVFITTMYHLMHPGKEMIKP